MPSLEHEAVLLLLRNRPALAVELLRSLAVDTPAFDSIDVISPELTQVVPVVFRADGVLKLCGPPPERRPLLGVIIEHQRSRDPDKLHSWPVYVTTVAADLRCPVCLLVIAGDESIAAWASNPILVGPGTVVRPLVIGPSGIPFVIDLETVESAPELAALSAMIHGRSDAPEAMAMVKLVLQTLANRGGETALLYCELIWNHLDPLGRAALESFMYEIDLPLKSPIRRAIEQGIAQGKAEGEAKGKAEGEAQSLFIVLTARGIPVPEEARSRILATTDTQELARWIRRAATAQSLDEVFAPDAP